MKINLNPKSKVRRLTPYHQMQFSAISRRLVRGGGLLEWIVRKIVWNLISGSLQAHTCLKNGVLIFFHLCLLYSHMLQLYTHTCRIHIGRNNKDERRLLLKKYTSHFIWKFVCERELETEQNCNILTPHSYGHQRCVFLVLLMLNRTPGGSAFCLVLTFSSHILSPTGLQTHWGSRGPFRLMVAFSTTSCL